MKTIFLCFLTFGAIIGYIGARIAHINSSQFKKRREKIGDAFAGALFGFFFTFLIAFFYMIENISNDPDRVAYQVMRPVVFHDTAKQCEFFIENKRLQYIVLEDN